MKTLFSFCFALVLTCTVLTGCQNTVNGFGKDLQQAGENIQKSNA